MQMFCGIRRRAAARSTSPPMRRRRECLHGVGPHGGDVLQDRHHAAAGVIGDPLAGAVRQVDQLAVVGGDELVQQPRRNDRRGGAAAAQLQNVVAGAGQRLDEDLLSPLAGCPAARAPRPGRRAPPGSAARRRPGRWRPARCRAGRRRRSSRCSRGPSPAGRTRPPRRLTSATSHFGAVTYSPISSMSRFCFTSGSTTQAV